MQTMARRDNKGDKYWDQLLAQCFSQGGPLRTLLDPFVTQSIALERFTDVLPAELGIGNRGGVTKTGSKVYYKQIQLEIKYPKVFSHTKRCGTRCFHNR